MTLYNNIFLDKNNYYLSKKLDSQFLFYITNLFATRITGKKLFGKFDLDKYLNKALTKAVKAPFNSQ